MLDWNYPFDFCGSIYRLESIIDIVDAIEEKVKMLKPNSFEYIGNATIKKKMIAKDQQFCMCMNLPVMTVVTVNKVQDVYVTPIYEFKSSEETKSTESE